MLVDLLPEQVSNYWPLFKGHIEDTVPPTADYGTYDTNNILYSLMFDYNHTKLWLCNDDKDRHNIGFVITTIMRDISGVNILLIYNMVVIDKEAKVNWLMELETLKKHAWGLGCSKIGAYVMNSKILDIVKEYEVETRFVFANLNI